MLLFINDEEYGNIHILTGHQLNSVKPDIIYDKQ